MGGWDGMGARQRGVCCVVFRWTIGPMSIVQLFTFSFFSVDIVVSVGKQKSKIGIMDREAGVVHAIWKNRQCKKTPRD